MNSDLQSNLSVLLLDVLLRLVVVLETRCSRFRPFVINDLNFFRYPMNFSDVSFCRVGSSHSPAITQITLSSVTLWLL
jgi:hypothetical protein